jgi:hypothetical protein
MNKSSRTVEKGWSSSLVGWAGDETPDSKKITSYKMILRARN